MTRKPQVVIEDQDTCQQQALIERLTEQCTRLERDLVKYKRTNDSLAKTNGFMLEELSYLTNSNDNHHRIESELVAEIVQFKARLIQEKNDRLKDSQHLLGRIGELQSNETVQPTESSPESD